MILAQAASALIPELASFGAAGLMGMMWLWERKQSFRYERQIREAHSRILRDEQRLAKLTQVVEQNTAALTRMTESQRMMMDTLRDLTREIHHEPTR
jgi:hypothetical protein